MPKLKANCKHLCFTAVLALVFCPQIFAAPVAKNCPLGSPELCNYQPNPRSGMPKPYMISKSIISTSSSQATEISTAMLAEEGDGIFFDSFEECMEFFAAYPDQDGDGWGAQVEPSLFCRQFPGGWVLVTGDCDDTRDSVHPGQSEICDDLDNNCDGAIDNADFQDTHEPNEFCGSSALLPSVGSNQTIMSNATVFPAGDSDYFTISANETDNSCECCDFLCFDEDYQLEILLSVPSGAGSYLFCTGVPCSAVGENCMQVSEGSQNSWTWTLDGACTLSDEYTRWVRVYGNISPGWSCRSYTLSYRFTPGCF